MYIMMPSNIFLPFLDILPKTAIFCAKKYQNFKNVKQKMSEKKWLILKNTLKRQEYVRWYHFGPEKLSLGFSEAKIWQI